MTLRERQTKIKDYRTILSSLTPEQRQSLIDKGVVAGYQ